MEKVIWDVQIRMTEIIRLGIKNLFTRQDSGAHLSQYYSSYWVKGPIKRRCSAVNSTIALTSIGLQFSGPFSLKSLHVALKPAHLPRVDSQFPFTVNVSCFFLLHWLSDARVTQVLVTLLLP